MRESRGKYSRCKVTCLVFHYAREFVDAIRETEPMQFRYEVHGALAKAAHYRDVSSEANIGNIYTGCLVNKQ